MKHSIRYFVFTILTLLSLETFAGVHVWAELQGSPDENQQLLGRSYSVCVQNMEFGLYECQSSVIRQSQFTANDGREFYVHPGPIRITITIDGVRVHSSDTIYYNTDMDGEFSRQINSGDVLRLLAPASTGNLSLCFVAGSYPIPGVIVSALGTTLVSDASGCVRSPANLPFGSYQVIASKNSTTISGVLRHDRNGKVYIYNANTGALTSN